MLRLRSGFAFGGILLFAVASGAPAVRDREDTLKVFRQVYDEVRVMPARPGELFIRQEFFIGEDDDDTNKDLSVSVVLPEGERPPVMIVQFTWMERDRADRRISRARLTKILRCVLERDTVQAKGVDGAAFEEKELRDLARGLLKAVRDKKRLLLKTPSRGPLGPREYLF